MSPVLAVAEAAAVAVDAVDDGAVGTAVVEFAVAAVAIDNAAVLVVAADFVEIWQDEVQALKTCFAAPM